MTKRPLSKGEQALQTSETQINSLVDAMCVVRLKGVIHYDRLPPCITVYSDLYFQKLMRLKQEVEKIRSELIKIKGVVFHHDNARPHTSLATQQILRGWLGSVNASTI
ncbi:Histone-lysine N-methyltransferase SETMAR [Eumeta japonica]|uniref:Histone-lysine N-methyltransferase SETMAR n=1 Tax=Eumeta variegata TaxID=151549 RepID=A0A4C1XAY3_EUMVA|nr:Histone-lysine N-methyltransferase SETMAR [Eumeta japonica]